MKIQKTRWRPDTCECILEHTWDSDIPAEEREVIEAICVQACPAHDGLKVDPLNMRASVLEENQRKNYALAEVLKTVPADCKEIHIDADGNENEVFKLGLEPEWQFNAERELVITLPAEAQVAKGDAIAAVDAKFAKVIIE